MIGTDVVAAPDPTRSPFRFGVASGDPATDSVVLWTATDEPSRSLRWQVASDAEFRSLVAEGRLEATSSTAQIRVDGLPPGERFHYRFGTDDADPVWSPTGTTSTLPTVAHEMRLGLASCARLPSAPFEPYRHLGQRNLDLVVHLGDYIYEDPSSGHLPSGRCLTIDDYRVRYRQYRRDPALQACHASAPWVNVWDDHDVANDAWRHGGPADLDDVPVDWDERHDAAKRALFEWIPQQPSSTGPTPMDRRVRWGGLVDIVLVDARHAGRTKPVKMSGPALVRPDDDRAILTEDQWAWLADCVADAAASGCWFVMCTPMQASPLRLALVPDLRRHLRLTPFVNPGQWDGYPVEQQRLADQLQPVAGRSLICSGDLHGRFVTRLTPQRGRPIPEMTVPSIASTPFADTLGAGLPFPVSADLLRRWLHRVNPHVDHMDLTGHGSTYLGITDDHIDVTAVDSRGHDAGVWRLAAGDDRLRATQ